MTYESYTRLLFNILCSNDLYAIFEEDGRIKEFGLPVHGGKFQYIVSTNKLYFQETSKKISPKRYKIEIGRNNDVIDEVKNIVGYLPIFDNV